MPCWSEPHDNPKEHWQFYSEGSVFGEVLGPFIRALEILFCICKTGFQA